MTAAARAAETAPLLRSAARSHPGLRRALNEDRVVDSPADGFWAVADGMGGHAGGEQAAERLRAALVAVGHDGLGYARLGRVTREVERVNGELWAAGGAQPGGAGGATVVALLVHEGHYACVWAGDSRAYLLRGGRLKRLTRDHTVVQDLVDAGALHPSGVRDHPLGHVVTRAVGAAPELELERRFAPVRPGDRFLLCSDGLTACLEDAEIAARLAEGEPEDTVGAMLADALARGAPDNVSVVVAAVRD